MFCAAPSFFLQTLELARQTYLGRCAHSINEKNPVEMIDLVLNRPRQKPGHFDLDRFTIRPQNRIAVLQDRQSHYSPRVNAGKFFTPASFNASMTLTIVPNDAFLSA